MRGRPPNSKKKSPLSRHAQTGSLFSHLTPAPARGKGCGVFVPRGSPLQTQAQPRSAKTPKALTLGVLRNRAAHHTPQKELKNYVHLFIFLTGSQTISL
jgi:hypothetical protein